MLAAQGWESRATSPSPAHHRGLWAQPRHPGVLRGATHPGGAEDAVWAHSGGPSLPELLVVRTERGSLDLFLAPAPVSASPLLRLQAAPPGDSPQGNPKTCRNLPKAGACRWHPGCRGEVRVPHFFTLWLRDVCRAWHPKNAANGHRGAQGSAADPMGTSAAGSGAGTGLLCCRGGGFCTAQLSGTPQHP